jgi:hypothetical protein
MPLLQKPRTSTASARIQIDIRSVKDGILTLPDKKYRSVLQVSSINFELKSEDEQDALIDIYESFLNSVSCPLQILIRTREVDLDRYLSELRERLQGETEIIYRQQIENYDEFIRSLITTNKILTRHFYIVIPYDSTHKTDFDIIREQLTQQSDIVARGLSRLGMQARELSSLEVLDLFYSFYSPNQAKLQPLTERALRLIHSDYIQKEAAR